MISNERANIMKQRSHLNTNFCSFVYLRKKYLHTLLKPSGIIINSWTAHKRHPNISWFYGKVLMTFICPAGTNYQHLTDCRENKDSWLTKSGTWQKGLQWWKTSGGYSAKTTSECKTVTWKPFHNFQWSLGVKDHWTGHPIKFTSGDV